MCNLPLGCWGSAGRCHCSCRRLSVRMHSFVFWQRNNVSLNRESLSPAYVSSSEGPLEIPRMGPWRRQTLLAWSVAGRIPIMRRAALTTATRFSPWPLVGSRPEKPMESCDDRSPRPMTAVAVETLGET